jgi:hypothetical protein
MVAPEGLEVKPGPVLEASFVLFVRQEATAA